jgi:ribonuclease HI
MAYTDGSQKKVPLLGQEEHEITVIGSGVYIPATPQAEAQPIGVRATQNGHNTAYRAELIAILGALRLGHPRIMTDSVNSIHAIKATLHRPAAIRYHRHKALLDEIKAAILAMGQPVHLIKIRGHAGIPGNEHADDIADRVARTNQADLDLTEVSSNQRPGTPLANTTGLEGGHLRGRKRNMDTGGEPRGRPHP